MEKDSAKKVLFKLAACYPNWNVNEGIAKVWIEELMKAEHEHVIANADEYIRSNKFPPSLSDIIKNNPRIDAQRQIESTRQMIDRTEEYVAPPWIREGISREEWMRKVIGGRS